MSPHFVDFRGIGGGRTSQQAPATDAFVPRCGITQVLMHRHSNCTHSCSSGLQCSAHTYAIIPKIPEQALGQSNPPGSFQPPFLPPCTPQFPRAELRLLLCPPGSGVLRAALEGAELLQRWTELPKLVSPVVSVVPQPIPSSGRCQLLQEKVTEPSSGRIPLPSDEFSPCSALIRALQPHSSAPSLNMGSNKLCLPLIFK